LGGDATGIASNSGEVDGILLARPAGRRFKQLVDVNWGKHNASAGSKV